MPKKIALSQKQIELNLFPQEPNVPLPPNQKGELLKALAELLLPSRQPVRNVIGKAGGE